MSEIENGLSKNKANYASLSPLSFLERTRKTFPNQIAIEYKDCLLYTSPSPRDQEASRMPSSA